MSGGTFAKCEGCGRLIIHGQRCVCDEVTPRDCDCTYSGNTQRLGLKCLEHRRQVWADAINGSRDIARRIAKGELP